MSLKSRIERLEKMIKPGRKLKFPDILICSAEDRQATEITWKEGRITREQGEAFGAFRKRGFDTMREQGLPLSPGALIGICDGNK